MSRNKSLGIAIAVAAILAISAFIAFSQKHSQGQRLRLAIGYRPTVVVDMGLLQGVESGAFERAGIDVTLKPYGRADLLLAALQSNEIQGSAGVPLEPLLGMAASGSYPGRGYLVWYFDAKTPYDGFLVPRDSAVNKLADLDGLVVGSHPSRQVKYFVSRMLPKANVQEYNPATPLLSLKTGDHASAYVLEPAISLALTSGEYRLIEPGGISRNLFSGARVPAALSLLSSSWIEAHPDEAAAFVRIARAVHQQALDQDNPTLRAAILGRREYGGYAADVAARVIEPSSSVPEDLDQAGLRKFFAALREGHLLAGDVDMSKLLYVPPAK